GPGGVLDRRGGEHGPVGGGDDGVRAVLLVQARRQPAGEAGVLVRDAAAGDAGGGPRHGGVPEPGGPGLRPAARGGLDAGGADDARQPRPGAAAAGGGRPVVPGAGGGGAAGGHPLRPHADDAAAAAAAARGVLAADLAPEPEPPVDQRPAGGQ